MNTTTEKNRIWLWILYIIYPLGSFIYAIKNYDVKKYRIFIYVFFLFYGYTFLPIPNSDGSRYKKIFESTDVYSFSSYCTDIGYVMNGNSEHTDFYHLTIHYLAKSISTDSRVYFLIAASVYFFVFLKLLSTIWTLITIKNAKYFISFFIGCCFIYNLSSGINGIRFPLAFMVFSLGALKLIIAKEKKYLFIAFLSILIHFAFVYSLVFLVLIYFLNFSIKQWVLYGVLIMVISFSFLFSSLIESQLGLFGTTAESKFTGYTSDGFLEKRANTRESWNFYVVFNLYSVYFFSVISIFLIKFKNFKVKFDSTSNKLFVFSIIMLIHSILSGSIVDTVTNRYNLLFIFFELVFLFYLSSINTGNSFLTFLNHVYIPILIINILIKIRADLYTVNALVFLGNFIVSLFIKESISIQDYLLN
ncbi:hypothetical protein GCM10022389_28280 [Flavobacterium cheonanense]|uniref:EpsG family protein n=1 Tax=Flavobacterium cheonanense TaxID=706183 RepID=A0ABP7W3W0_9FLAO